MRVGNSQFFGEVNFVVSTHTSPKITNHGQNFLAQVRFGDHILFPFLMSAFYKGSMQIGAFKDVKLAASSTRSLGSSCHAFFYRIENILFTNIHPHALTHDAHTKLFYPGRAFILV